MTEVFIDHVEDGGEIWYDAKDILTYMGYGKPEYSLKYNRPKGVTPIKIINGRTWWNMLALCKFNNILKNDKNRGALCEELVQSLTQQEQQPVKVKDLPKLATVRVKSEAGYVPEKLYTLLFKKRADSKEGNITTTQELSVKVEDLSQGVLVSELKTYLEQDFTLNTITEQ